MEENKEKQAMTWAEYYRDRVENRDYRDSFSVKYARFVDEIIIRIKQLKAVSGEPVVLKEEGCGIGSISRAISSREPELLKRLGIVDAEIEADRGEVCKVIFADNDQQMLALCVRNTEKFHYGAYLGDKAFFYTMENIQNPKFFEPNTVVITHGVLEHFTCADVKRIIATYNDPNVVFQAHYVPTNGYTTPSFGNERLMAVEHWIELVQPDYYIVDNNGLDLYMFKFNR